MSENTTLETITDYLTDVRTLLLDSVQPYRYDDPSLLTAFNTALLEGRRLRADLFVFRHGDRVPSFTSNNGDKVHMEPQFRLAFVYGTAAHALLRDQEDVQDARASSFMATFREMLTGVKTPPITGGTPNSPATR